MSRYAPGMFTPADYAEIARACRSFAHIMERDAKMHAGMSIEGIAQEAVERFNGYADRLERLSKAPAPAAENPTPPPSSAPDAPP